jgi:hypothetical protein
MSLPRHRDAQTMSRRLAWRPTEAAHNRLSKTDRKHPHSNDVLISNGVRSQNQSMRPVEFGEALTAGTRLAGGEEDPINALERWCDRLGLVEAEIDHWYA